MLAALFLAGALVPHRAVAQANPFLGGGRQTAPSRDVSPGDGVPPGGSASGEALPGGAPAGDAAEGKDGAGGAAPAARPMAFTEYGPPRTALGAWLRSTQRDLSRSLAQTLRAVRRGETSGAFWLILSLSFVYGVIHSLLPGHRKVLLVSYFMAGTARPLTGLVAGFSLAAVHAGAAVMVVLGAYFLVETSLSATVAQASLAIHLTTSVLVLLVGLVMLVLKIREARGHGHSHDHGHHHDHSHAGDLAGEHDLADEHDQADEVRHGSGCGCTAALRKRPADTSRKLLPVIVLSGIVPCPGSSMIMIFALSVGVLALGLVAVGAFAVGMALSLSGVCIATIFVKERIHLLLESRRGHSLHHGIEIGSAAAMVIFGLFLVAPFLL
ncbi:hypothetical protein [Alkalispirochaeta alkalica]|uniref:HoxN/HupN/NixA family nickel/cobalt transporter n=1 Tax=Alkalispirochaeta alkalica TaxID=46356 RepID=UPI00035E9139|nr:hypothetical protein [Alkalispirochaeta alkalica]